MRRFVALLLVVTALPAAADDFYVSVGAGLAVFDDTASAATAPFPEPGQSLIFSSVNNQRFDANESAIELGLGWQIRDWVALELAYTDFGNAEQRFDGLALPLPTVIGVPAVTPDPLLFPPPPFSAGFSVATMFPSTSSLGVETWSVNARFRKPLGNRFSANWTVGVSRADFDAVGTFTVNQIVSFNPIVTQPQSFVYEDPGDETGFRYGFGVEWALNDRFAFDLGYQRHDARVIELETVLIRLNVSL
ncbi:MAG: outer membrane beta-barrel protein [Pseudomonadota bacterium]